MKKTIFSFLIFIVFQVLCVAQTLPLMPYPKNVTLRNGYFVIGENLSSKINGPYSKRVSFEIKEFFKKLSKRTGIEFYENGKALLFINYKRTVKKLKPFISEYYELLIDKEKIVLNSYTDVGIIRGLQTLLQLEMVNNKNYVFPCVFIKDYPRFRWRGLLIDVSRHFFSVETIKRNIDAMAFVKMNVLHLHLTDDQGFRVESKVYPKLHLIGSNGEYYSQEEIREIVKYADLRGIRVIPEFDIPGHTTSWLVAYPELGITEVKHYNKEKYFGVKDPVFDPSNKRVYKFLKKFFKEMSKLFPDDYIHIGGDEVNGKYWSKSKRIKKFMKRHRLKNFHELQAFFNKKIIKILNKYGKKAVGWDEVFNDNLPRDSIVIQSWRGKESLYETAKRGFFSILSNGYYIDLCEPAWKHYLNDPLSDERALNEEEKKYILGGEATMWAELINEETIDSRIWPRTAAIAERFWSDKNIRNIRDMYERLKLLSIQLEENGLTHIKNREMLLRRLVYPEDPEPLKIFINLIEPLRGYKRHEFRIYSINTPLSMIEDTAVPDPIFSREILFLLEDWIKRRNENSKFRLLTVINKWEKSYPDILNISQKIPSLNEIKNVAADINILLKNTKEFIISGNYSESEIKKIKNSYKIPVRIAILPSIKESLLKNPKNLH